MLAALLISAASACSEKPPFELRYETEHLRIGVADDGVLCGGDLSRFEQQISNVEELLSTDLDGKVDVYLWQDPSTEVDEYCAHHYSGCYRDETKTIYTMESSIGHELVHAVAIPLGDPSPMWSEGVAEALDIRRVFLGGTAPTENFSRDSDELNYASAGYFTRWVWAAHGPQAVRDLLTDTRDSQVAFEAIAGQTLEAAEADYYAEAPWGFALLASCQAPKLEEVEPTCWTDSVSIDCSNEETLHGDAGNGVFRSFEVEARGDFQFVSDASTLLIQRCPDEDIPERPETEDCTVSLR